MVIVVGAGPAGMMAAIQASSSDELVTIVEKNTSPGRKLLLTGGGRCNLTNSCDSADLVNHYSKTGNFLRDAFRSFDNEKLLMFFTERGLRVKTEDNGRVFPVTDKAQSVLDVLLKELKARKVSFLTGKKVKDLCLRGDTVVGVSFADGSEARAEKVILAAGGVSYKKIGSTGDGIRMAEKTGHRIVPLKPGLVALRLEAPEGGLPEGVSLGKAILTFRSGNSRFATSQGSLIFTANGISGPVTLSSSSRVVDWLDKEKKVSVSIDILPEQSAEDLTELLCRKFKASPMKNIKNTLKEIVPSRIADMTLEIACIQPSMKADRITVKERNHITETLKGLKFVVTGRAPIDTAQVTRGGVSVKEIDPETMASKKVNGLYFAGEMIDVDGESGGYNLQAAFSTGYTAGKACAQTGKTLA